jgi:hypothetical protein
MDSSFYLTTTNPSDFHGKLVTYSFYNETGRRGRLPRLAPAEIAPDLEGVAQKLLDDPDIGEQVQGDFFGGKA